MASLPSELQMAEALFIKFEKVLPDLEEQDLRKFVKAHEMVRTYLDSNPTSHYAEIAKRLRIIYTRRFLEESRNMFPLLPFPRWLEVWIQLLSMKDDLQPLFKEKPALNQTYDVFWSQYPEFDFRNWSPEHFRSFLEGLRNQVN